MITNHWRPAQVLNFETGEWERRGMVCISRVDTRPTIPPGTVRRIRSYLVRRRRVLEMYPRYDSIAAEIDDINNVLRDLEEIEEMAA